jgi:hypothetical protein
MSLPGTDAGFRFRQLGVAMFRQWAMAVGLACGGGALAEPYTPVPPSKPDERPVYVMRTAGQNDRHIQVVRAADPSDPASLAEVMDTATKKTFVIPGKVLAKLPKAGTPAAAPPVAVEPPLAVAPPPPEAPPKVVTPLPPAGVPQLVQVPPELPPAAVRPPVVVVEPSAKPIPASPPVLVVEPSAKPLTAPPPAQLLPPVQPPAPTATLPTVASPVHQAPQAEKQPADPWQSTGQPRAIAPTPPPPAAGPRLTPVPTWRATPRSTPPGVTDPWRPTGG